MARSLLTDSELKQNHLLSAKLYRDKNKNKLASYGVQYRNNNKEKLKTQRAVYLAIHKEKNAKVASEYRAKKLQRSVGWEKELTQFVLEEAHSLRVLRNTLCRFLWHVDHVIPLQGKIVSGLHVWNNIQVIPASTNQSKGNVYAHLSK